jgi:protein-tyrosine phosphatase
MSSWFRTYGFAEITDGLLVGAVPSDAEDVRMLKFIGVLRVLNLMEDTEYAAGDRDVVERAYAEAEIIERRLRLVDFGGLPASALDVAVEKVSEWLDEGLRCYVHCRAGWQRSATVAAAVVAVRFDMDVDQALAFVKRAKPSADPLEHQREDLAEWFEARQARRSPPPCDS